MMNALEFKSMLESRILSTKRAHRTSLHQIALRCPLCGDSKKDLTKTRFYIRLDPNDNSPILYHCFNCNESGILTPEILRAIQIDDLETSTELLTFNKKAIKNLTKTLGLKNKYFDFKIPKVNLNGQNSLKKQYIERRLGVSLSLDMINKFKIIFSLKDFLQLNNIDEVTVPDYIANRLERDYVGFLTMKNEFIIFRDITGKNKWRYNKYTVISGLENPKKNYTIPGTIDVLSEKPIIINMCEGVFDVLGVYFHVFKQYQENIIYTAVSDSAYLKVLDYFISLGIIGSNIRINIFSDSDKDIGWYHSFIEEAKLWNIKVRIFYNRIGKDFGVRKDEISIYEKKI